MLYDLKDKQWERIKESLPGKKGDSGRSAKDNRKFIAAVMWIGRTGAPWRALPEEYGKWFSVHKRFIRLAKAGHISMQLVLKKNEETEEENQGLGRSKGGYSTKLHAACDALGNPLRFFVTAGQRSDYVKALDLVEGKKMAALIADKGYDANYMIKAAEAINAEPNIHNTSIFGIFIQFAQLKYLPTFKENGAISGYQGWQKVQSNVVIPYKRYRKKPLTEEQKEHSRKLASFRMQVENKIREIKIFKIISNVYRNFQKKYNMRFNIIAGGLLLWNEQIEKFYGYPQNIQFSTSELNTKKVIEQVKVAIDSSDPKFLQILLGIRHCQLQEDWFAHAILSHKIIGVIHTLRYQLPINIISAQQQLLDRNFSHRIYGTLPNMYDIDEPDDLSYIIASSENVTKVNKELEDVEREILQRYKSFKHETVDGKYHVFNVRDMIDVNKYTYSYDGSDYTGGNICLKDAAESLKSNIALQSILKLDISSQYDKMYKEMYKEIISQYQLRIKDGQSINSLYEGSTSLMRKISELRDGDDRLRSILNSISKEVVDGIQSDKFMTEVYDKLIDNLLYTALKVKDHPLHEELKGVSGSAEEKVKILKKKIKEQAEVNNQHQRIKESMEYAANSETPDIDILNVLIANGASLLASYVEDSKTGNSITVQEKLQQLGGEYKSLIGKSIFTITRKVHNLVFDFPMEGEEDVDLLKLVSEVPSEDGCFAESGENIRLLDNIGSEGANEFMDLLKACINDTSAREEEEDMYSRVAAILSDTLSFKKKEKEFEEAYAKLYGCIKIGYSAIKTRDDKVIVDYLSEIEEEAKHSKNPHIKKLYGKFFTILSEYNDLPKSMFLTRWLKYVTRTAKSYSGYEWSPAWEKILTDPGYRTDVGEWSKNKFEEIKETEIKREKSALTARAQSAEQQAAQADQRTEQANQRAAQEAQEKEEFKQKAEQEAQRAEQEAQRANKLAEALEKMGVDLNTVLNDSGFNHKELLQKREAEEVLESECQVLLNNFGEMKMYWWWPWSRKIKDVKLTVAQWERAINYDDSSFVWSSYFPGRAVGGVGALVIEDRFSSLIKAIILSGETDSPTLSEELKSFKLQWLLMDLDTSLQEMEAGKKTKDEHNEYAKEKIKNVQRLSLKCHPDVTHMATTGAQQKVGAVLKAVRKVHNYVIETRRGHGYLYRLFGELSVELINNEENLSKLVNIVACGKLWEIAYWEEGRLMENRNYYLKEAREHYVKLCKNKLSLLKDLLNTEPVPIEGIISIRDMIGKVQKELDEDIKKYKKLYNDVWVKNLKKLSEECKKEEKLQVIKPEIDELFKKSHEQYEILQGKKTGKVKADEIFAQPILEYRNLMNMYYKLVMKLSKNIEKGCTQNDVIYLSQQKFVLGEENTGFTNASKEYIKELSEQELCKFVELMVGFYCDKQGREKLQGVIYGYYQGNGKKIYEIGNILIFALSRLAELLEEKFVEKETFFQKEEKRREEAVKESEAIKKLIEEYEQQAAQADQRTEQANQRAAQEAQEKEEFKQKAEQEAQRAEQEAQRANKLAEALEKMGVDLNTVLNDSGFNHKELLQKREAEEVLESECQVLLNNFGEMKMYWWWPWSRKIKDVKLTVAQWERAINYDDSSFVWSSYFPGRAVGGVGALVIEDRFSSLIKAIILSGETDSPTLSEELKSFKLQWLLMDLDTSLQEMEAGKKTKDEHNEYAKEKIKNVQRLSLKCHPDVTHMATTGAQQKVAAVLKAVRKVHNYVIETRRGHGYLYRLFGELSVELINNEENLSKLVNIVACGKLWEIAYWEEGRLMENRNYYLKEAREHYVKLCKNKLSLLKDLLNTEPVPIEGIISIRDMIGKVQKELDEDIKKYKKLYNDVWVKNLKKLSEECKKEEKLQVIKPEIDELLKKSHEQYEILQGKKTGKVKADEIFAQPILEYRNLMNMYYKLVMKLSKNIEKGCTQNDVIYLSQQKFVLGEENTGFTNASKEYIKELSEQELCKFVELMVGFYCDKQGREKLQGVIYGYYQGNGKKIYEIGNILIFALSRLAELLEEKFVEKETFFQKEEKRREEAVKESEAIKKLIEEYEQQAAQADQRTEQANQRAAQEAQEKEEFKQKAEQEAQRAEQEAQRANKLAEALEKMGVDLNTVLNDSGFNHKELLQKREAEEVLESECQVLLNNFGEMKMYWWWPWSRKIKDVKLTVAQWERAINYDDSSFVW
ncbi:Harbinger transposase-derived nuclease domain,Putative transposase IS4/IS5 family, partial [Cinara cedri]